MAVFVIFASKFEKISFWWLPFTFSGYKEAKNNKLVVTIKKSRIMKKLMMTLMAVVIAIAANAQYNTNYYNQYGGSIGSSTTR